MADRRRGTPPPLWPVPEAATPEPPELPHPHPVRVAVRWIRWHWRELGTVAIPLLPAATVSWWFAVAVPPLVALWVWHEIQLRDVGRGSHER